MTTGESNVNGLPNASRVLREAYELVSRPDVTGLGIDRAGVLLGIARELREGARRAPAVVIGDNVPDNVVNAINAMGVERDKWRRDAEAAQREIAGLLRQGNFWRDRAEAAEAANRDRLGVMPWGDGFAVKSSEFGQTYGGEPAYADPGLFNAAVSEVPDELRESLGGVVHEQTRQVPQILPDRPADAERIAAIVDEATATFPNDAARRLRMTEVKVDEPAERPADIRFGEPQADTSGVTWPLVEGICANCQTATYEAITADGKQVRHRETGTPACPAA